MKIKPLTKDQILVSLDRLTRFRHTEFKYVRVFSDLILHNLIEPSFSKNDVEKMDYKDLRKYAQEVLNYSVKTIVGENSSDLTINKRLFKYENSVAYLDDNMQWLIKNGIDYKSCITLIDDNDYRPNLRWLKSLDNPEEMKEQRMKYGLVYPVEVAVLVEGLTESTLLPEFAKVYGFDFDKNGIFVIPAGGKNQVVKVFYELSTQFRHSIYVLFDKDGQTNAKEIQPKLRSQDKIHILKCGEFEDALSSELVNRTLKSELENISETDIDFKEVKGQRVKYLEEIFKHRGMHEFQKADFAQKVRENISSKSDLTPDIVEIIDEIKKMKSNC